MLPLLLESDAGEPSGQDPAFKPPERLTDPDAKTIALLVRNQETPEDRPWAASTHSDVELSTGEPVGYYGEMDDSGTGSSGGSSLSKTDSLGSVKSSASPSSTGSTGMGMEGTVYRYDEMAGTPGVPGKRPQYVNGDAARSMDMPTTRCTLPVTDEEAADFDSWWLDMDARTESDTDSETFSICEDNCSSHAAEAFAAAGLLPSGEMPGFDSPLLLEDDLRAEYGDALKCESGYYDAAKKPDGTFDSTITPP